MKFSRFGLFGFLVLTLAAGLNVAALYTAEQRFAELREAGNWVRHTQDAENLIAHIYRKTVDAETGQRGFLLTQDETYLNPYLDARVEIPKDLAALGELTRDNPVQVVQLATVNKLMATRIDQMERSLKHKRDRDDDAIREFLLSHEGMVTMTSLRLALDGMATEEKTQYQRRIGLLTQNQNQLRRGFLLLVGLNLLLVTLGGIFLNQEARRRRNEAQEAEERNVQLAQAVNERTAELTGLSHHLQRLQEEEKGQDRAGDPRRARRHARGGQDRPAARFPTSFPAAMRSARASFASCRRSTTRFRSSAGSSRTFVRRCSTISASAPRSNGSAASSASAGTSPAGSKCPTTACGSLLPTASRSIASCRKR